MHKIFKRAHNSAKKNLKYHLQYVWPAGKRKHLSQISKIELLAVSDSSIQADYHAFGIVQLSQVVFFL